jgi:hypothetical protein
MVVEFAVILGIYLSVVALALRVLPRRVRH